MSYRAPLALLLLSAAASPAAAEPVLSQPIDCILGETCHIQSYVDTDPSTAARDFTCGTMTYDGHKGTDFALPSLVALEKGVNVLAAADGVVRATRDGMDDRIMTAENEGDVEGRECGNGVVLTHPDGWETQYCHLKRGSIAVRSGTRVASGAVLGQVGLSGRTQFPHVHLSVRRGDTVIDPFAPEAAPDTCGTAPDRTLWQEAPPYRPGGLISAGFATTVPDYATVKAGQAALPELAQDAPAIVFWAFAFGSQSGDTLDLRIIGPEGEVFAHRDTLDRTQAQFFRAGGKRLRAALPPGLYTGEATLTRDGRALDTITAEIEAR